MPILIYIDKIYATYDKLGVIYYSAPNIYKRKMKRRK